MLRAHSRKRRRMARHANLGCHLVEPYRVVVAGAAECGQEQPGQRTGGLHAQRGFARSPARRATWWPRASPLTAGPWNCSTRPANAPPRTTWNEQGVALAVQAASTADLCLWVVDAAAAPVLPTVGTDRNVHPTSMDFGHVCVVINKIDLPAAWDTTSVAVCAFRRIRARASNNCAR